MDQIQTSPLQSPELLPSPTSFSSRGPSSPTARSRRATNLSLDLSNLPALTQPVTPTNTLIFTNLEEPAIFLKDNLYKIKDLIAADAPAGVYDLAPLPSMKRFLVYFHSEADAIAIRKKWDGTDILGNRCKIFFGTQASLQEGSTHLALPDAGKLFFISPPPSPPHGWEGGLEGEPNKMVHAEDLADALAKLRHGNDPNAGMNISTGGQSPISPADSSSMGGGAGSISRPQRSRSSTLIFQPQGMPSLPCVTVDDMTDDVDDSSDMMDISPVTKPIMAHTSRPPVELMHDA